VAFRLGHAHGIPLSVADATQGERCASMKSIADQLAYEGRSRRAIRQKQVRIASAERPHIRVADEYPLKFLDTELFLFRRHPHVE
jgi:hypothetical protein